MKFGKYLEANKDLEWSNFYIDYSALKSIIKKLKAEHLSSPIPYHQPVSLSVPPSSNTSSLFNQNADKSLPGQSHTTQEIFFDFFESEMHKVQNFTEQLVDSIRDELNKVERRVKAVKVEEQSSEQNSANEEKSNFSEVESLRREVEIIGERFLRLEKFVNLNFMGFHKILKKHDRHLPTPCKPFYIGRLHNQKWVKGDHSGIIVQMSRIYSKLRADVIPEEIETAKQDFVRTTTKYWVRTEDISRVKYIILQHLPVFLQKTSAGDSDSQLTNSIYLDNSSMELYHGRLDKTPGAIALRLRWYGTGEPKLVFVERKTHRDSWTGEVSVKERFIIPAEKVPALLQGYFDKQTEIEKMRKEGKPEAEIEDWDELVSGIIQAINSKQLVPTMRTQYMRTAFQIPFDATVRVSLDTNLCMICEGGEKDRWFRDPSKKVPKNEITRFPHAVLEVKLQLQDESEIPSWVSNLINSGMLIQVHKFSKFIHGCAVLLNDEVQSVPYWIDDPSISSSILQSDAVVVLHQGTKSIHNVYSQLLPTKQVSKSSEHPNFRQLQYQSLSNTDNPNLQNDSNKFNDDNKEQHLQQKYQQFDSLPDSTDRCCFGCLDWAKPTDFHKRFAPQKVEPKLFFANERTFLRWLNMAVTLFSLSIIVLSFTEDGTIAQIYGLMMLPVSLSFCVYALYTFTWRSELIKTRVSSRWDDPIGPVFLTSCLAIALVFNFAVRIYDYMERPIIS